MLPRDEDVLRFGVSFPEHAFNGLLGLSHWIQHRSDDAEAYGIAVHQFHSYLLRNDVWMGILQTGMHLRFAKGRAFCQDIATRRLLGLRSSPTPKKSVHIVKSVSPL